MLTLNLSGPWLDYLRSGKKKVEGRVRKKKYQNLQEGDYVLMKDQKQSERFLVLGIRRYQSIRQYLLMEGLRNTLPGVKSLEEGVKIYRQWFQEEQVQKLGFLAIEVIKN